MDGRQDRIIIIETFRLGTATRCVGRIKGQLGQEPLSALVASGDLVQLGDVSGPESSIIVQPVEVRLVPLPNESKFRWPGRLAFSHSSNHLGKGWPVLGRRLWNVHCEQKTRPSGCRLPWPPWSVQCLAAA